MAMKHFRITLADLESAERWSRTNRPIPRAMLKVLKPGCIVWEESRDVVILAPGDRDDMAKVTLPQYLTDLMTLYEHGQPVRTPIEFKLEIPNRFL